MAKEKATRVTKAEKKMLELLARLARAAKVELLCDCRSRQLAQSLSEAEYAVRDHWRLVR